MAELKLWTGARRKAVTHLTSAYTAGPKAALHPPVPAPGPGHSSAVAPAQLPDRLGPRATRSVPRNSLTGAATAGSPSSATAPAAPPPRSPELQLSTEVANARVTGRRRLRPGAWG